MKSRAWSSRCCGLVSNVDRPEHISLVERACLYSGKNAKNQKNDNAKTFKSAAKEVKSIGRSTEVQRFLANKGIVWDFIVEKGPWHGGFWERMIQSTKPCLRKSLGSTSMNFESLQTLLIEIEATINNQPLMYIYDDEEGVSYPLNAFPPDIWKKDRF